MSFFPWFIYFTVCVWGGVGRDWWQSPVMTHCKNSRSFTLMIMNPAVTWFLLLRYNKVHLFSHFWAPFWVVVVVVVVINGFVCSYFQQIVHSLLRSIDRYR
jgi:hypothetical protein